MTTADGTREIDIPSLLDIAAWLLRDGDAEGALQVCNDILVAAPRNAQALACKGRALMGVGRYDQAVRFLERASESDPGRADVWGMLGTAALAAGNGEVALKAYTHLQRFDAEPAENYLNLARAAYFSLDLERARDYVDLSLAENPDLALSKEWETALKAIPDHASFLIDVGRAHGRRGRFEHGLSLFLESLKEREAADGHLYAGRALLALGRPTEAQEHLTRASELDKENTEVLSDLASALALNGDAAGATRVYDQVLATDPDRIEVLLGKAQLLVDAGDSTAAKPVVDRLIELAPQQPETWFLQARMLAHDGDGFNARLAAERAIVRDPRSPLTWLAAAELMQMVDQAGLAQLSRGRADFAKTGKTPSSARKDSPVLPELTAEAAELDGAGLTDEQMAEALRNRATVYANLGQVETALQYLGLLTERLPQFETEELARHKGSLLLRLGDPVGARHSFERALELDPDSHHAQLAIQRLDALAV